MNDLKFALRSLRRAPGVTLILLLTLALGIGATGAIWSVIDGVILEPLPYEDPEELAMLYSEFPTMDFERFWISPPEFMEYEEWTQAFEAIAGYRGFEVSLVGKDEPMRVRGMMATASLFDVIGTNPQIGRPFSAEEDNPDGERVAVIAYELWQRTFGGDESVLGEVVDIDGNPTTIIGVMPRGFDLDDTKPQVWVPMGLDRSNRSNRGSHYLRVIGRLSDGTSLEAARTEAQSLVEGWDELSPNDHNPDPEFHPFRIEPLKQEIVGDTQPALMALLGAVSFVLLIACANVANLLLARSEERQQEMAVRAAMGASRWRLVRQVLTESVLLSVVGGVLGVVLAHQGLKLLLGISPEALPRASAVELDGTVLLFSALVAVLAGVLFGIAPALQLSSRRLGAAVREGGRRATAGVAGRGLRRALVVVEIALALALVVGAGLMLRSFQSLLEVHPGFASSNLMSFAVELPDSRYPEADDQTTFMTRLTETLAGTPGITAVAASDEIPPVATLNANDTEFEGIERTPDGPPHNTDYWWTVTRGFFETLGTRIVDGRVFGPGDGPGSNPVVVINEATAKRFYGDTRAVGQRLRPPFGSEIPWFTIIGVVEDIKQAGVDAEAGTHLFWSYEQLAQLGFAPSEMYYVVESTLEEDSLAGTLRQAVWAIDPALPVADIRTLDTVVADSLARPRLLTVLLSLFGLAALFLAAIGIYGVLAHSVATRAQELGIRMAMGANQRRILGLVLGQGLSLAAAGLALGILASLALRRALDSMLYGIGATDPMSWAFGIGFFALVAALACLIPALRATRVDPISVLRAD